MVKTLAIYLLVFGLLFALGTSAHMYIIGYHNFSIGFSLDHVYLFHAVYSFLLCSILFLLCMLKKWQDQLGFFYLGALAFKLIFFMIIFSNNLFGQTQLNGAERLSLMVPVFVFLIPEVYFIAKILSKIELVNK